MLLEVQPLSQTFLFGNGDSYPRLDKVAVFGEMAREVAAATNAHQCRLIPSLRLPLRALIF